MLYVDCRKCNRRGGIICVGKMHRMLQLCVQNLFSYIYKDCYTVPLCTSIVRVQLCVQKCYTTGVCTEIVTAKNKLIYKCTLYINLA
jgi:hypothetical protein